MHEIVSFTKDIEFKNMINKITSISLEHTLMHDNDSNVKGDFIVSGSYRMTPASQIENDFSYKIPVDIEIDEKYDLTNLVIDIDDFTYEIVDEDTLRVNIDLLLDKLELKESLVLEKDSDIDICDDDDLLDSDDLFLELDTKKPLEIERDIEEDIEEEKEEKEENTPSTNDVREESENRNEIQEELLDNTTQIDDSHDKEKLEQCLQEEITLDCDDVEKKEEITKEDEEKMEKINSDAPSLFSSFDNANETYSTYSVYIIREGDSLDSIINKYKTTKEKLEEYNDLSDLKIGTKIIVPSAKNE